MKYLITESRLESSIVKYIKGRYPQVEAVGFSHDRVRYCDNSNVVDKYTDIIVIFDRENHPMSISDLNLLWENLTEDVDELYNLDLDMYCSKWEMVAKEYETRGGVKVYYNVDFY